MDPINRNEETERIKNKFTTYLIKTVNWICGNANKMLMTIKIMLYTMAKVMIIMKMIAIVPIIIIIVAVTIVTKY